MIKLIDIAIFTGKSKDYISHLPQKNVFKIKTKLIDSFLYIEDNEALRIISKYSNEGAKLFIQYISILKKLKELGLMK